MRIPILRGMCRYGINSVGYAANQWVKNLRAEYANDVEDIYLCVVIRLGIYSSYSERKDFGKRKRIIEKLHSYKCCGVFCFGVPVVPINLSLLKKYGNNICFSKIM